MAFSINVLSLRYFLALTILFFIKLYHDVGASFIPTVPSGPGDLPFLLFDPLNRLIGESFGFHSPAVVESHRIECEVELIRKIKGDLLRALGFNYSLILTEDDLFKFLDHRFRFLKVVVPGDRAISPATVM